MLKLHFLSLCYRHHLLRCSLAAPQEPSAVLGLCQSRGPTVCSPELLALHHQEAERIAAV